MRGADTKEAVRRRRAEGIVARAPCIAGVSRNVAPLGVIEDVECFGPELEAYVLGDAEVFKQGHVEISPTRVAQAVAAGIPKG